MAFASSLQLFYEMRFLTEDFSMCHYVGFSQIGPQPTYLGIFHCIQSVCVGPCVCVHACLCVKSVTTDIAKDSGNFVGGFSY